MRKKKETKLILYQGKDNQLYKHPQFQPELELITQTRVKKASRLKMLHSYAQTFIQKAQEEASVTSFSITITYPLDKDYLESWTLLESRIANLLTKLYQFPIYALLLSICLIIKSRKT